ncbi:MAG TPA: hypothetical protein PLS46_16595, partial [Microthrixaceae bacterium]|nr:hypothetical protein [Microthrixaceae bacterium]
MATTQKKKTSKPRSTSSKSSTSSRAKPAQRSSTRAPSRSRAVAPPQPTLGQRVADSLSMVLDGHGHDVWGLAFVALGLVGAFGVYGHSAGPVGTGLAALLGAVFGLSRYLVPPMFAVAAYFLIRGPREPEIDEETGEV